MAEPSVRSSVELRVRYSETDQMGVVYHANYLVWCDIGRTELIREITGKSYAELERAGVILAVSEVWTRYHASARYDERVRVETWVEEVRSRTMTFAYRISRLDDSGSGEKLASARTTLIALDRDGRPRKLPPHFVAPLRGGDPSGGPGYAIGDEINRTRGNDET
ncbi:MAG: acyl-CoA thioesterase, partial [Gemmatimonadota bacterium]|nr:acyl-CoA thioesterase [Gemmatimonadota bacterium]